MKYPFNMNMVEQLELDPVKPINGYVWFNKVEKVYKTWIDGTIQVFLTDAIIGDNIDTHIKDTLTSHQIIITFTNSQSVIIKHNKGTRNFIYNVFDDDLNINLPVSIEIFDDNEVRLDFVDPVTGHIFMQFQ